MDTMDQSNQYDPNDPYAPNNVDPAHAGGMRQTQGDQHDDEREMAQDAANPNSTGVVGAPSGTGMGATSVVGTPSGTGAGASGVAGSSAGEDDTGFVGEPSETGMDATGVEGSSGYDAAQHGIDTQGYDTTNQGLGSGQGYGGANADDVNAQQDPDNPMNNPMP